jgi:PadR family transcriptional regulator PadR
MRRMVTEGNAWLGQLRRGAAEYCVLALLAQRERYGFELAQELSRAELLAGEGTVYPLLSRLRRHGWVDTNWRESSQGPPRRYYRLTEDGRSALRRFAAEWTRFRAAVDKILGTDVEGTWHDE